MFRNLAIFFTLIFYCSCTVLEFLHTPESVKLPSDGTLTSSDIPLAINNLMGFSADKPVDWSPQTSLWQRPEAAVVFVVKTPHHMKLKLPYTQTYKLQDNDLPDMNEVSSTMEEAFSDDNSVVFNVNTDIYGSRADDARRFMVQSKQQTELSKELSAVEAVSKWAVNDKAVLRNGIPDLYIFEIDGLLDLSSDNEKMTDAIEQLNKLIKQVSSNFVNVYDGNLLVCVVAGPGAKIRRPRAADPTSTSTSTPTEKKPTNYSFYNQNYPVIFNIILWSMLTLAVAILFIATAMWFMDPGRDSIIYRMTMTRAKKD